MAGFIFAKDFPEIEQQMRSGDTAVAGSAGIGSPAMGMSYELADAHVADMRAQVWTLTQATFTGAAILLRDKAAYQDTSFRVHARRHSGVRSH